MPGDYDSQSIDNVHKEGLFDSEFDPMVLGLGDEEKARLSRGLTSAGEQLEGKLAGEGGARKRKKKKTRSPDKVSFFAKVVRWIIMLFTGMDRAEFEKKQQLRQIRRKLAHVRPQVYNFNQGTVLPALGYQLYSLYSLVSSFAPVFERIFEISSGSDSVDFELFYIRAASRNSSVSGMSSFSAGAISEAAESEDELAVRKRMENAVHAFLASFDEEEKDYLNKVYNEIQCFRDIMHFPFVRLLRQFGWDPDSGEQKPAFREVEGGVVIEPLKELEKLLLSVNLRLMPAVLDLGVEFFRSEMMSGMEPAEGEMKNAIFEKIRSEEYRSFSTSVSRLLKENKLTLLAAYQDKNPGYEVHIHPRSRHFFAEFSRVLSSSVSDAVSAVYKQRKRQEVNKKLCTLFGSEDLHNGYLYSEATNRILKKFEIPVFLYTVSLILAVRFFKDKYFHHHKRLVNKLLVNGSFRNSLTRRMLADEFYRIDELNEKLAEFVSFVDPKTDKGVQLGNMVNNYNGDGPSKKALSNRIAEINHAAHGVLKQVHSTMHNLQIAVSQVVKDIRSRSPETIDNLSKISGANNTKFIKDLVEMDTELELFCELFSRTFETS